MNVFYSKFKMWMYIFWVNNIIFRIGWLKIQSNNMWMKKSRNVYFSGMKYNAMIWSLITSQWKNELRTRFAYTLIQLDWNEILHDIIAPLRLFCIIIGGSCNLYWFSNIDRLCWISHVNNIVNSSIKRHFVKLLYFICFFPFPFRFHFCFWYHCCYYFSHTLRFICFASSSTQSPVQIVTLFCVLSNPKRCG